jgi:hypothetical protein
LERNHLEDLDLDEGITIKWKSMKLNEKTWTGPLWFRIGTGGGLL